MLGVLTCSRVNRLCKYTPIFRHFHSSSIRQSIPGLAMNWSASVLSTVSSDTEPTIIVAFDNAKYIFNAGENTSRSFLQSRRHWRRARGIFLTSVGSQRCSGLPGLLMFWADAGISRVEIVGPQGLLHYLASMRAYLKRFVSVAVSCRSCCVNGII